MKSNCFNLAHAIDNRLVNQSDEIALRFMERRAIDRKALELSAAELRTLMLCLSHQLQGHELSDHPVIIAMSAGMDFIVSMLACIHAGIVVVPIAIPQRTSQFNRFDKIISDSGARLLLSDATSFASLQSHLEESALQLQLMEINYLDLNDASLSPVRTNKGSGEPVIIQYTSGSTRDPRGVVLTSANIMSNAALVKDRWHLGENKLLVNWLPHFHDMGLIGGILFPLINGAKSLQMSPLTFIQKPIRWLQAISDYRATHSGGPPFAFAHCLDSIANSDMQEIDLSSWEVAFCAAEAVPAKLLQRFRQYFAQCNLDNEGVHACYGLAESTLFVAGERRWGEQRSVESALTIDSTEPCLLSVKTQQHIQIVDPDDMKPLREGETGEIWVTGSSVAACYYNNTLQSKEVFNQSIEGVKGQWLRTGDIGYIHHNSLYVTGRLKNILIINGMNISVSDIEWLAAEQDITLNPLAAITFASSFENNSDAYLLIELKSSKNKPDNVEQLKTRIQRVIMDEVGVSLLEIFILRRGSLERTTSGKIKRAHETDRFRTGFRHIEVEN